MKLSISNIGWLAENDEAVYALMKKYGYAGLEIAPTRVLPFNPYDRVQEAREWGEKLHCRYGFVIPSMQSIWFGRMERLFGEIQERQALIDYTKKAIDFAEAIGCRNLVFGCPKNRSIPEGADEEIAIGFFRELGSYALQHNTVIGMEANPPIYQTNYINNTRQAIELIQAVGSDGFKLNLDVGTMIQNEEDAEELVGSVYLIHHVHISEPGLKLIKKRELHQKVKSILVSEKYSGFISIEMGRTEGVYDIEYAMKYIRECFG